MEDAVDWWARGVGLAALLIALGSLGWNIFNAVVRDRAKLAVECSFSVLHWEGNVVDCIGVGASNVGRRPISLQAATLNADDGRKLHQIQGTFTRYGQVGLLIDESHKTPKRLNEGETHTFFFPVEGLREAIRQDSIRIAVAEVRDGTGHKWHKKLHRNLVSTIYK